MRIIKLHINNINLQRAQVLNINYCTSICCEPAFSCEKGNIYCKEILHIAQGPKFSVNCHPL